MAGSANINCSFCELMTINIIILLIICSSYHGFGTILWDACNSSFQATFITIISVSVLIVFLVGAIKRNKKFYQALACWSFMAAIYVIICLMWTLTRQDDHECNIYVPFRHRDSIVSTLVALIALTGLSIRVIMSGDLASDDSDGSGHQLRRISSVGSHFQGEKIRLETTI